MKALEILKILKQAKTFDEYGVIFDGNSEHRLSEAIEELEALKNKSCANCKRVNNCKLANDIVDNFGTKLKEQYFYCWELKC